MNRFNLLTARRLHRSWGDASRWMASACPQQQSRSPATPLTSGAPATPPPGPVLTFLSPSPARSRSAVEFLNELFHLPRIDGEWERGTRDRLDRLHFGPAASSSWDSVACACPTSGAILHLLSLSAGESREATPSPDLHLIAIHGSFSDVTASSRRLPCCSEEHYRDAVMECRKRLAENIQNRQIFPQRDGVEGSELASNMEARFRGLLMNFTRSVTGIEPNPSWILNKFASSSGPISPILDLAPLLSNAPSFMTDDSNEFSLGRASPSKQRGNAGKLRELALPFFPARSSLQGELSKSSLLRPLPGLYQCPAGPTVNQTRARHNTTDNPGLIFRPLPAAQEDLRLSPPSLVFQCDSLTDVQNLIEEKLGGRTFKIGWRGHGLPGSLRVGHPSVLGLDIRVSEGAGDDWVLSSSFDEAQEALLAGSLKELQSTHVVSEGRSDGGETSSIRGDAKTLNGDCWIEFRSNLKHPAGFVKRFASYLLREPSRNSVAKPPRLDYE